MYKPAPTLATKAASRKTGKTRICQLGAYPYHAYNKNNNANEMAKSTKLVITDAVGIINLGK
jgi:hypothetical protein